MMPRNILPNVRIARPDTIIQCYPDRRAIYLSIHRASRPWKTRPGRIRVSMSASGTSPHFAALRSLVAIGA